MKEQITRFYGAFQEGVAVRPVEIGGNGGWGRNRTGVNGVADRCMTTLPPSLTDVDDSLVEFELHLLT